MTETITMGQNLYPQNLKNISDPPKKLHYLGKAEILQKTSISIVGTRSNTDYGEDMTRQIIRELSILDIAIVSGLARGIDTIAHRCALENGLPTIAVLGSGLRNTYPPDNAGLAAEMSEKGLLLSEYEDNAPPLKMNFPQRNRIISGLSIATIVIEAPEKSGALITARSALDQGREVFILPGDVDRKTSLGGLKLLQKGAYPICSGQDIIELLREQPHLFKRRKITSPNMPESEIFNLSREQEIVLNQITARRTTSISRLIEKTKLETPEVLNAVSILEVYGLIALKDGKYKRT